MNIMNNYAFQYCEGLTSIVIPDSVIEIGIHAFQYCSSLETITIPSSVTFLGNYAFSGCTKLTRVEFEDQTGWKAYNGSTLKYSISDLSNATTNATNLKNRSTSPSSPSTSAQRLASAESVSILAIPI